MKVVRQAGLWCRANDKQGDDAARERRQRLARRTIKHLEVAMPLANLEGAAIIFSYYFFVDTPPDLHGFATPLVNGLVLLFIFPIFALISRCAQP